ncbi:MAG: TrbC/VirB2 family protein [Betaproteobacteria bacterium]|nr:TrbC/VirB2 family protein [Betaproteobacteria bacterium]
MKPILKKLHAIAARRLVLAGAVFVSTMTDAFAAGAGGLPWDTAISTLTNDLTGPVATGISTIAFLAAGATLVFGEELGGIAKKALYVVLGVAFIVLGNKFLTVLGLTGATVV